MDLHKNHPTEDELILQYFNVGLCKAAAVIGVVNIRCRMYTCSTTSSILIAVIVIAVLERPSKLSPFDHIFKVVKSS